MSNVGITCYDNNKPSPSHHPFLLVVCLPFPNGWFHRHCFTQINASDHGFNMVQSTLTEFNLTNNIETAVKRAPMSGLCHFDEREDHA